MNELLLKSTKKAAQQKEQLLNLFSHLYRISKNKYTKYEGNRNTIIVIAFANYGIYIDVTNKLMIAKEANMIEKIIR